MTIPSIPHTPYGEIPHHWHEWLDALNAWEFPRELATPRFFQPAGDLESLRARVAEVDGLRAGVESAFREVQRADLPAEIDDPRVVRQWSGRAVACANWWLLSEEDAAVERAWQCAKAVMNAPVWVSPEHLPLTIDLYAGSNFRSLAVMMDKLGSALPDGQREELVQFLITRGVTRFVDIADAHSEWWTYSTHNWRSVICENLGMAALAVAESLDDDILRRALKHATIGQLAVLDQGDDDGGWFEGMGYWRMGIGDAVRFIDVLHRLTEGKVDLFTHAFLQKTGDFGLHLTWPDGKVFHFADCGETVVASELMARLARATKNGHWQAYLERYGFTPSIDTLYWRDADLVARPYDELPKVKVFRGAGAAVLRAGWQQGDMTVAIKAGETTANHSHLDIGSFQVRANGRAFIDDGGHWPYGHSLGMFELETTRWDFPGLATECHSTILVDGQGQAYGPEHKGTFVGWGQREGWSFATVDASAAYPQLKKFVRYFLFIEPDRLVVVDDLAAPERVRFNWRAVVRTPVLAGGWPGWSLIPEEEDSSMLVRCLSPSADEGFTADVTEKRTTYPSTHGQADIKVSTLTVSPMIRRRECVFAFAMRAAADKEVRDPRIAVREAHRSLHIIDDDSGSRSSRVWSIMWGEPGIQLME